MSVIRDWTEVAPGTWELVCTLPAVGVDGWVKRWFGKVMKTPGGKGRVESIITDEGNGEARVTVKVKADL